MNANAMATIVRETLQSCQRSLEGLIANEEMQLQIAMAAKTIATSFNQGGRVFSCGNGGSMCDAMHFAEELTGRFRENRRALPAIAIADPSHMSCTANDFGFDFVFSRFLEAHGRAGDILLAISTSGSSKNVLLAAQTAKSLKIPVIGLTGIFKPAFAENCEHLIVTAADSKYADRVQEMHIKCIHILIQLIETELGMN